MDQNFKNADEPAEDYLKVKVGDEPKCAQINGKGAGSAPARTVLQKVRYRFGRLLGEREADSQEFQALFNKTMAILYWFVRPFLRFQDKLPLPDGFVSLAEAWKLSLKMGAAWGVIMHREDAALLRSVSERVGRAAAAGKIRVAGISRSGEAYWFPASTWVTPKGSGDVIQYPAYMAARGGLIRIQTKFGEDLCQPFISHRDLAVALGGSLPPKEPEASWIKVLEVQSPNTAAALDQPIMETHGATADPKAQRIWHTGLKGRPTSIDPVLEEMEVRFKQGLLSRSAAAEARVLAKWLREKYPNAPPLSAGRMQNEPKFADLYKELKGTGKATINRKMKK